MRSRAKSRAAPKITKIMRNSGKLKTRYFVMHSGVRNEQFSLKIHRSPRSPKKHVFGALCFSFLGVLCFSFFGVLIALLIAPFFPEQLLGSCLKMKPKSSTPRSNIFAFQTPRNRALSFSRATRWPCPGWAPAFKAAASKAKRENFCRLGPSVLRDLRRFAGPSVGESSWHGCRGRLRSVSRGGQA